jgi:hypothetical protein
MHCAWTGKGRQICKAKPHIPSSEILFCGYYNYYGANNYEKIQGLGGRDLKISK